MGKGAKKPYLVTQQSLPILLKYGFKKCSKCNKDIKAGDICVRTLGHILHKGCMKWI